MIKLIDPQRQKELEDIIVNLQVQVTQLSSEVQRLQEANRRNQRDIQKVYREVQESFRPQTRHMDASHWDTLTRADIERGVMSTPAVPTRMQDERETYQRIWDTMSGPVRLDGTPVHVVIGTSEPYKDVASVWDYPRVTQEDVFDDL